MRKRKVRLSESEFHRFVEGCVRDVLETRTRKRNMRRLTEWDNPDPSDSSIFTSPDDEDYGKPDPNDIDGLDNPILARPPKRDKWRDATDSVINNTDWIIN